MRDGRTLPPAEYCTNLRMGGRRVDDVVDAAKVAARLADGATLVLQSLQRTHHPVGRFTAALEAEVSHPVQANAYLTPAGASGLSRHADGHDVIVVQLHGSKHWVIDGLGAVELTPGDVVYLPAGTEHEAEAQRSASLHLTIGLLRVTYRAVVERLLRTAGGLLDAPLPLGYATGGTGLADEIGEALAEVGKVLEAADPAAVAERERARRRPRVRHEGHLLSVLRAGDLGTGSVVALRPGPVPRATTGSDGRIAVDLGDRTVELPPAAASSLDRLLQGGPVTVGELPGIDAEGQLVLVRRLVREGMLLVDRPR